MPMPPEGNDAELLASLVEPGWYLDHYPDVAAMGLDPATHYQAYGPATWRDPNRFFDCRWYAARYPEVAASGFDPITHYLRSGAAALLDPHPRFDAGWYVQQHPDAAANPVLYHLRVGRAGGFPTEKPLDISDFLPSELPPPRLPAATFVDVIAPVFANLDDAKHGLSPLLADRSFPIGRIIVFDHAASDPALSEWLGALAANGEIYLIRERGRARFSTNAMRGIEAADTHDVILLQGGARISPASLRRLASHAGSSPRIATISAFFDDGGYPATQLEDTARSVNSGRSVKIPSGSAICLYIPRKALRAVGGLIAGPDAVADFSRRATMAGWQHRLAFDAVAGRLNQYAQDELNTRKLDSFATEQERQWSPAAGDPFRFALTAGLFKKSRLPVILMVSHNLGGGIRRHINSLAERYIGRAHVLLLAGTVRGASLSVPLQPDHPVVTLPPEHVNHIVKLLRSAGVTRVHIHHLLDQVIDVRGLIQRLGVPFDVTVHDYFAICPQVNLLRWPEGLYCGEPNSAGCNRCIADFSSHHAKEILSWRREQAWQFIEADRVICPSEDVRTRLSRYGAGGNALVAPHQFHPPGDWPMAQPDDTGTPLRVVLLGVLANHKGARIVASVAEAADRGTLAIHLIGHLEASFPKPAIKFINATGTYREADLQALLAQARPHVFWFPSTAPETYSYTLTTAIETGLPIIATNLGSFKERLAGRPDTWLVDHNATTDDWLATFQDVRNRLRDRRLPPPVPRPSPASDFYEKHYLSPKTGRQATASRTRPRIALLPDRLQTGALTDSAYIRLLQPLDHPAIGSGFDILLTTIDTVFDTAADLIVTQRHAIPDRQTADRLAAHVRRIGGALIFDLDDDLLNPNAIHPAKTQAVRRMLSVADTVWLSTQALADRLLSIRPDAVVIEDKLDERIWTAPPAPTPYWDDPIRILYLRTTTPDTDLAIIEPALTRLKAEYGHRISIDVLAIARPRDLPHELNAIGPSANGGRSYPGFVDWMTRSRPGWHIGLAPMADTPFNRCRSPIKALDYAAMGLAVLASDVPAYRGSIADGPAGQLVANNPVAWHSALDWLIRDQDLRRRLAVQARTSFIAGGCLASKAEARPAALRSLLLDGRLRDRSVALTIPHDQSHSAPRTRRRSGGGR